MTRLVLGVLLWSLVHMLPGLTKDLKKNLVDRIGEYPYKGLFLLFMVLSIYLIISGWTSMTPVEPDVLAELYTAPEWGGYAAALLVLIGFILFLAPYPPNNFKRMLRHPQLIGMVCWGAGHLLAVGTARSIVLFGGLSVWAIIEMFLINRRDGEWVRPEQVSFMKDFTQVLFSVLAYMAFLYTHHMLFGGTELI
ncbi:NnrU family protein [Pseudomonadota bacterium]